MGKTALEITNEALLRIGQDKKSVKKLKTKKYKCVNITICQVDNGFEVDFSSSFQSDVQKGNTGGIESMYVAKTEKEIVSIITKVLPEIKEQSKSCVSFHDYGEFPMRYFTDLLQKKKLHGDKE